MEAKIRNIIPFIITPKKLKYLDMNLPKHVQVLHAEINKMLMKKIKEDLNKGDMHCIHGLKDST